MKLYLNYVNICFLCYHLALHCVPQNKRIMCIYVDVFHDSPGEVFSEKLVKK